MAETLVASASGTGGSIASNTPGIRAQELEVVNSMKKGDSRGEKVVKDLKRDRKHVVDVHHIGLEP
jgi:hypothetical protein